MPPNLLLSFDLEDCDQILARRLGNPAWDRPWEGFERQVSRVLELLDSLGAKATFFVLGMTARNHPERVRELAARGHDIAAHGLDPTLAQRTLAASYWLRAKPGWGTLPDRLRQIAKRFELVTYAAAIEHLDRDEHPRSRPRALSAGGVIV